MKLSVNADLKLTFFDLAGVPPKWNLLISRTMNFFELNHLATYIALTKQSSELREISVTTTSCFVCEKFNKKS